MTVSKEMDFLIYLLEAYAQEKGRSASEVLREWEHHDVVQAIYDNYLMYHSEALENAFADIDRLVGRSAPVAPCSGECSG